MGDNNDIVERLNVEAKAERARWGGTRTYASCLHLDAAAEIERLRAVRSVTPTPSPPENVLTADAILAILDVELRKIDRLDLVSLVGLLSRVPSEVPSPPEPDAQRVREWGNTVSGRCPACKSNGTLFVAVGGHITCSLDVCPNPTIVADVLLGERASFDEPTSRSVSEVQVEAAARAACNEWVGSDDFDHVDMAPSMRGKWRRVALAALGAALTDQETGTT